MNLKRRTLLIGAVALTAGAVPFAISRMRKLSMISNPISPTVFGYVPGNILNCATFGRAAHDIDLEVEFKTKYGAEMGLETGPQGDYDVFVDPANGSDTTGNGFLHNPYRTLKKAVQHTYGTIWLKPGRYTEKLDIRNSDRQLSSGESRALIIKAWGAAGSAVIVGAGQQPWQMTWTANGSAWEATPAGGEIAELILYVSNGKEYPIQYVASVDAVNQRGYGWHQDPTTKNITIRYEGRDLNAEKSKFEIIYQTPGSSVLLGSKTYFEGITFRGGSQIEVKYENNIRPVLYAKNCTFEYIAGSNIHTEGAICFTQNCVSRRALVGDGFNYYDSTASGFTPGGTPTEALEVDNKCVDNGVTECRSYVNYVDNQPRNKQGSSGHQTTRVCRINGYYAGNYGQNIADTGAGSYTWMVGSVLGNPYGEIGGGATLGGYYNLWLEGTCYLDTISAAGRLSTYGLWLENGTTHVRNCEFSGTVAATGGPGAIAPYEPPPA